jgi:membrane associated rhomboid family serine protease
MPGPTWVEVARAATREGAEELAFVLEASGIPSGAVRGASSHVVVVRLEDAAAARDALSKYAAENGAPRLAQPPPNPVSLGLDAALIYAIVLVLAFALQRRAAFGLDWWGHGAADAAAMQAGAWWRAVTALTLHGDAVHLAGNVVFGALFGVMLAQSVGAGTAWLAIVATGAAGNLANAWLQSPRHVSIGASTAVFGALGAQVAFDWIRRRSVHHTRWRRWAPLAIGAALLAWLGGGGEPIDPGTLRERLPGFQATVQTIDVGAHVLGFVAGLAAGAALALRAGRLARPGPTQAVLGAATVAIVAIAWMFAMRG